MLSFLVGTIVFVLTISTNVNGQEEIKNQSFTVNADLYSNYVWRGTRFGQGPHFQPSVTYSTGGLAIGIWGSFDSHGFSEADPYLSYTFPFGLSLGITDYYYPGLSLFEFSEEDGSHALEVNGGYTMGGFSLNANYIVNEAAGAASAGNDLYFQTGYTFSGFSLFAGAGNGWHTSDGKFNFCNIGLGAVKKIDITELFSIPLSGKIIINPEREQLYLVAGFSF